MNSLRWSIDFWILRRTNTCKHHQKQATVFSSCLTVKVSSHLIFCLYWTRKNLEHFRSLADEQSPKVTLFHLLDIFSSMDFISPFSHWFFFSFSLLFSLFVVCPSFPFRFHITNYSINFVAKCWTSQLTIWRAVFGNFLCRLSGVSLKHTGISTRRSLCSSQHCKFGASLWGVVYCIQT